MGDLHAWCTQQLQSFLQTDDDTTRMFVDMLFEMNQSSSAQKVRDYLEYAPIYTYDRS